jgi:lysophospholipase L1-like esterase
MSIRDAVATLKPEYLIITLGINGISYMDEVEFKEEYTDLIGTVQEASPDTKIICNSIYPVIDPDAPVGINNAGVNQANEWVYQIAEATGTRYLNTHDALMDETGSLRAEYCNGDGVHLDTPGIETVLMNVRTHGYR